MERTPLRVLLVEDDEDDFVLVRDLLQEITNQSYSLDWAKTYHEALLAMEEYHHDVYLLDYRLDAHSGLELIREAFERRDCHAPIIFLTGQGDDEVDMEVMRAGAEDYLVKGQVNAALLERSIRHSIGRKRTEEALRRVHDELERRVEERTRELSLLNAAMRDEIAERKRTEEALRESEQLSSAVINSLTAQIAVLDGAGNIIAINQAGKRFAAENGSEGPSFLDIGVNYFDAYKKACRPDEQEDTTRALTGIRDVLSRKTRQFVMEYSCQSPTEESWFMMSVVPLGNNHKGVVVSHTAITEIKRAQEIIKQNAEKLKLFAYSVIHDLKSPTIGIHGLTRLLKKHSREVLDEKGKTFCDQIIKASEHIALLVEQINIYIASKEAPLRLEKMDPKVILQGVREEFLPQFSLRQVEWVEPEAMMEITVDRLCFIRVLRNLVDNALKYGGEELSKIRIGYEESERFHIFSVSDDGVGLKKNSEKIFELFRRNEGSKGIEGTGLGLAIVKEIVGRHGGSVWTEPGQDNGITFFVSILKHLGA